MQLVVKRKSQEKLVIDLLLDIDRGRDSIVRESKAS